MLYSDFKKRFYVNLGKLILSMISNQSLVVVVLVVVLVVVVVVDVVVEVVVVVVVLVVVVGAAIVLVLVRRDVGLIEAVGCFGRFVGRGFLVGRVLFGLGARVVLVLGRFVGRLLEQIKKVL